MEKGIIIKLLGGNWIDHTIRYLGCVRRVKELTREITRLEINIKNCPEPDFFDPHMEELRKRGLAGDEAAEIEYRDWLYSENEKHFQEIEDTPEYRENDRILTQLCERYSETQDELEITRTECETALHDVHKSFAKHIEQIADSEST
jgi:hypothetical protein